MDSFDEHFHSKIENQKISLFEPASQSIENEESSPISFYQWAFSQPNYWISMAADLTKLEILFSLDFQLIWADGANLISFDTTIES